jgi:hypothetical protein
MYRVDEWQWDGVLCVLVGMPEHNVDPLTCRASSQSADDLVRLHTQRPYLVRAGSCRWSGVSISVPM